MTGTTFAGLSTFETFNVGVSINGQSGWTVEDQWGHDFVESGKLANLDESIVDDGTGNKVWRISNAHAYSEYSSQPFSPTADLVAGETGSSLWNDRGPDHTQPYNPPHFGANAATNQFSIAFRFRSATGAAQPGLAISLSPSAKQSTVRMSYLNIADNGTTGFDLLFYDTSNGDQDWNPTTVASGLSYSDWHTVRIEVAFVDGVDSSGGQIDGNDVLKIYVDGSLVHTGTTWESYYYAEGEGVAEPRLQAVDSLLFRVAGTAASATLGQGFYFDDVEINSPAVLAVDDDGLASFGSCDAGTAAFTTIGAAVAAASPGDTIKVCPGTYPSVTVNKSVTLLGANAGVHPAVGTHPTETVGVRGPESVVAGLSPAADGITVDGFKFLKAGTRLIDTYVDANDFHLTNCIVESTVNGPTTGVVQIAGGSHTDMVLDFNLFLDKGDTTFYTGGGPFDRLRIAYNRFNVEGDSIFWTASPLVDGVIEGNEFDGTIGGVPGVGFAEINIGQGGNIAIRDNWFHDQQYIAFQVGIIGGSVTGNTIERMYPYSTYGADAFQLWGGQWGTAVSTNVDISCNTIHYNDIPGAASPTHGIRLRAPETGSGIDGSTIHISNNTFADGGARADAKAIRHQGDASTTVDAENNWWGTTSGSAIAALMSGSVDFTPWLDSPPVCSLPGNVLYLVPTGESIYIQPGESILVDMNVANLLQYVNACQAMLGYSSTYFAEPTGATIQAPGSGPWDQIIWDSWVDSAGVPGEIDTAIGVNAAGSVGTNADNKVAKISLTSRTGVEGVTQIVFRPDLVPDPGLVKSTFLSDMTGQAVWPSKLDSANIIIDGTAPTISVTSAVQGATNVLDGANTVVQGTVTIQVQASDALAGLAAAPAVELTNGTATVNLTTTDTASPFSYTWTVDASTTNGQWAINASVADRAGNTAADTDNYLVLNKNQITGLVELESLNPPAGGVIRNVTFAANGGAKTWTIPVSFAQGSAIGTYTLTDVPDGTTSLSAKTDWNLRRKLGVTIGEVVSTVGNVSATITKTNGAAGVTFDIVIHTTGPHYGAGLAIGTSADYPNASFQVYFADFSDQQWHYQDYGTGWNGPDTTTLPLGFSASGDASGNTFSITVPYSALGGSGVPYYWSLQVRTNLIGRYPESWIPWSGDTSTFAKSESSQLLADFTGDEKLLGGDFNATNSINVLDYSIMKANWGPGLAADVNGDGFTGTIDYGIMKANWFKVGDEQ
jgi:hypothetical protein